MATVIIPISGGIDSAYLLFDAIVNGHDVYPIIFDDGTSTYQSKVIGPATAIIRDAGLGHRIKVLPLALTNNERISDEGFGYIAGRNMSMAMIALSYADFITFTSGRKAEVQLGFAASNEGFYPDQKLTMFNDLALMYNTIYGTELSITLPLEALDRLEVVHLASKIGVPLHKTVSCAASPIAINCGVCPRCRDRRYSFSALKIEDTTLYLKD